MMTWIQFNEWCARHSTRGRVRTANGIHAAWAHTALIINNLTTPDGPLAKTAELQARARAAAEDAAPRSLPWMLGTPEPWLPFSVEEASAALAEVGFRHMVYMTAM